MIGRKGGGSMKILIFSDSHGYLDHMVQATEKEQPDCIIHLGDHLKDGEALARLFPHIPLEQVPGNCDFCPTENPEKTLSFENVSLLICHGHTLRVKESYQIARYTGMERGVNAVLFGHTHVPYLYESPELILLNPGSIGRYRPSYAVMELQNDSCTCSLYKI